MSQTPPSDHGPNFLEPVEPGSGDAPIRSGILYFGRTATKAEWHDYYNGKTQCGEAGLSSARFEPIHGRLFAVAVNETFREALSQGREAGE